MLSHAVTKHAKVLHHKHPGFFHRLFHPLLHPHLRRHIHLESLNVTVGAWQLLLWGAIVPIAWGLYRFVYRRIRPRRTAAYVLLGAVLPLQAAAFGQFALTRDADVLFVVLWCSLISLLVGAVLLPQLRFQGGRAAPLRS